MQELTFDILSGENGPSNMFGEILSNNTHTSTYETINNLVIEVSNKINEGFGLSINCDLAGVVTLEKIINEMWSDGWDPETGNINLFCTDFGLIYFSAIERNSKLIPVFRSKEDLSHCSLYSAQGDFEVFPFHKIYKMLVDIEGESLVQLFQQVTKNKIKFG